MGELAPCVREWGGHLGSWGGPLRALAPCVKAGGCPLWMGGTLGMLAPSARVWGGPLWGALGLCAGPLGVLVPKAMPQGPSCPSPPGLVMGRSLGWPCWGSPLLASPQGPGVPLPGRDAGAPVVCLHPPGLAPRGPAGPQALLWGAAVAGPGEDGRVLPLQSHAAHGRVPEAEGTPSHPCTEGAVLNPVGCPSLSPGA